MLRILKKKNKDSENGESITVTVKTATKIR